MATDIFDRFREIVRDRDSVVVELGTNDGSDTKTLYSIANEVAKSVRYIALEPDYRIIPAALNKFHGLNIEFVNAAISDSIGKTTFYLSGGGYTGSSSIKKPTGVLKDYPSMTFNEVSIVDTLTWDSLFSAFNIDHIDFIWMDIQGAETCMLRGGQNTGINLTRYLYTEYCNGGLYEDDGNLNDIIGLLPGWEIEHDYQGDVLLRNAKYKEGWLIK